MSNTISKKLKLKEIRIRDFGDEGVG